MKLEKLALVAEIIGSVAIVITLVILILEVRGNTSELRAATLANIAARTQEFALLSARSRQLTEVQEKRNAGELLDPSDLNQLSSILIGALKLAEESFIAEREGRLDQEIWETRAAFMLGQLSHEVAREQYALFRDGGVLIEDFTAWLDLELAERYGE